MKKRWAKLLIISITIIITLGLHYYDLLFEGFLGHSHFLHAVHGRLCYIPIVLGAVWFGLRGGMIVATVISIMSFGYIVIKPVSEPHELTGEYAEIMFYYAIGGLAGILVDRDKAVRRKKELAEQKLLQTDRLWVMGEMAASIAHEVKNPLGSIRGAAHILQDPELSSQERIEFSAIIENESIRLNKIVDDYLSYSRPAPLSISEFNICGLLQSIHKQLFFQANECGVKIDLKLIQNEIIIRGDAGRLHQAFINIIINAIQAMIDGGKIEISCDKIVNDATNCLRIDIADNGPGIPPEILPKVFDPFFSTKTQGTGLGLSTTKDIIKEHKGKIAVESIVGKGTCFHITLPIEEVTN